VLHACDSDPDPAQVAPPLDGAGLLQRRVRDWVPPPHVRLQVPKADQVPQFPLTANLIVDTYYKLYTNYFFKRK